MKYRKKPVVIEAIRVKGSLEEPYLTVPSWALDPRIEWFTDGHADIRTLEGLMRADVGDWIIKGVRGELYPCKHDIFLETYEAVEEG